MSGRATLDNLLARFFPEHSLWQFRQELGLVLPRAPMRDRFSQEHWQLFESMPQELTDLIDDLTKMRLYKPQAPNLATTLTQVEMKEALNLAFANPSYPNKGVFPCQ